MRCLRSILDHRSDWEEWRLVIATPDVDTFGQLPVTGILVRLPLDPHVRRRLLDRVVVDRMQDPRVQALRHSRWIEVGGEGVWLGRTVVGGVSFEDAYLYRAR